MQNVSALLRRQAQQSACVRLIRRTPPPPLACERPERSTRLYDAQEVWVRARTDDAFVCSHPYAILKGITWAAGARRAVASRKIIGNGADCLMIPIRSMGGGGQLISLQCINPAGEAQAFGPLGDEGGLILGNTLDKPIPWVVVKDWADAVFLVLHHYGGNAVGIAAFWPKRIKTIARAVARYYRPKRIDAMEVWE